MGKNTAGSAPMRTTSKIHFANELKLSNRLRNETYTITRLWRSSCASCASWVDFLGFGSSKSKRCLPAYGKDAASPTVLELLERGGEGTAKSSRFRSLPYTKACRKRAGIVEV